MNNMVRYRSGHNGNDLKSFVSVKRPVGSNPTLTAISNLYKYIKKRRLKLKQGKKLTRDQKAIVDSNGLNVNEWAYVKESDVIVGGIQIVNKNTKEIKDIKYIKKKRKQPAIA